MGLNTLIQWCDSTVNPTENCDGCELWNPERGVFICYAGRFTERIRGKGAFDAPIKLHPGRMAAAAKWPDLRGKRRAGKPWIPATLPRLIFVSDMSDALSLKVEFQFLFEEIVFVASRPPGDRHIWIWLTKRPMRMAAFSKWLKDHGVRWPSNVWAIASVTNQNVARVRIPKLFDVGDKHTVRGISAEPLLGEIDLTEIEGLRGRKLDWIITGGESGRNTDGGTFERIADLVDQSEDLNVPCFVKQMGTDPAWADKKGGDWSEWPLAVRVRDFPQPKSSYEPPSPGNPKGPPNDFPLPPAMEKGVGRAQ